MTVHVYKLNMLRNQICFYRNNRLAVKNHHRVSNNSIELVNLFYCDDDILVHKKLKEKEI